MPLDGPGAVVDAPASAPPRLSLVVASANPPWDDRLGKGFRFEPELCTGAGVEPFCPDVSKDIPDGPDIVEVQPFLTWAGDKCRARGQAARNFQKRATDLLLKCESALIASEFESGTLAIANTWPNTYLRKAGADVLSTSAGTTPLGALACLEDSLAACSCGSRGMIHANRRIVTHWVHEGMLRRDGNLLLTALDTIVVPDAGYTGAPPATVLPIPNVEWAYATGMVEVRRGPIVVIPDTVGEALNRVGNVLEYRAERPASVSYDNCCRIAVGVILEPCTA